MRKIFSFLITCAVSLAASTAAVAQDIPDLHRLIGKNLYDAFLGKTMDGIYKQPRERSGSNEFTESFYKDGTTYYREGDVTDEGHWWIKDESIICFSYSGELAGGESCFAVYESGSCLYSYNPRNVRNGKPINSNAWSAKTLTWGDISTCDNLIS